MNTPLYLAGILEVKSYRAIQSKVAEVVKSCGLNTVADWFVLSHIHYKGESRAAELAEMLEVEPPFITALLGDLEAAGLVEKVTHKEDKRVKVLSLSQKGSTLIPEMEIAVQAVLDNLLDGVKTEELETYKKVMGRIVKNST